MHMIRLSVTIITCLLAVSFSTAYAATYSWTDEQGTVHFSEDPGRLPEKSRKKILRLDEGVTVPDEKAAPQAPSGKDPEAERQAVPTGGDNGIYAGKTYEQWQKELAEREAAMTAVRNRLDEIAALFRSPDTGKDERKQLVAEYNSLSAQLKEMKAQYFEQVEIARKAGLTI